MEQCTIHNLFELGFYRSIDPLQFEENDQNNVIVRITDSLAVKRLRYQDLYGFAEQFMERREMIDCLYFQGEKLLKESIDALKLVTKQYSKRQIRWVRNRLIRRKDRKVFT